MKMLQSRASSISWSVSHQLHYVYRPQRQVVSDSETLCELNAECKGVYMLFAYTHSSFTLLHASCFRYIVRPPQIGFKVVPRSRNGCLVFAATPLASSNSRQSRIEQAILRIRAIRYIDNLMIPIISRLPRDRDINGKLSISPDMLLSMMDV